MGVGEIATKSLQTRVHALYKLIKSNATFANKFRMNVAYIKCKTRIHTYTYTQAHTLYIKELKKHMWGWGKIEIWQKIIQYWNECVGASACEFVSLYDIYIMHICVCVCMCVSFFAENLKSNIYLMHKQMKHALRFVYGDMKNASSFLHKWKWTCNWITRVQRG